MGDSAELRGTLALMGRMNKGSNEYVGNTLGDCKLHLQDTYYLMIEGAN